MSEAWPALDALLAGLRTAPSRTGSVIATIYGDAILPRGGSLALADLLALMQRLGASGGVVRTAISRLARDGVLSGRKTGRHSAYALTASATAEFLAASPRIYGPQHATWDGSLRLGFPDGAAERGVLEGAGFVPLTPGVMVSHRAGPAGIGVLEAGGAEDVCRALAARAWPVETVRGQYEAFAGVFEGLSGTAPAALEAMAARVMLVHAWRRIALRDPHLPLGLLPQPWPGERARALCVRCYAELAAGSEAWLDGASAGSAPLAAGPDPALRFSGGDTRSAAPASSPGPAGSPRPLRSATR